MTQAIARNPQGRPIDLATGEVLGAVLDIYADDGEVVPSQPDCICTISAGQMGANGLPEASRDGTIYIHDPDGVAPGLKAALAARGGKSLTISAGFDELRDTLQWHFVRYSAGRLEAHGDASQITVLDVTEWKPTKTGGRTPVAVRRLSYPRGTEEYKAEKRLCKVAWSLYFYLADWGIESGQTRILMPDGYGLYRLRAQSRHGLMAVYSRLEGLWKSTGGRLKGMPLELSLTYPEVADPLGVRRKIPRWTLLFKPPLAEGIVLDQLVWGQLATQGLAAGRQLALAPPREETWEIAEEDERALAVPSDEELDAMLTGDGPAALNEAYWRREWFGQVQGSSLAEDGARATFIRERTGGRTSSLAEAIRSSKNSQMQELVTSAAEKAGAERMGTAGQGTSSAASPNAAVSGAPVDPPPTGVSDTELAELRRKASEYERIMAMQNGEAPQAEVSAQAAPRKQAAGGPAGVAGDEMDRYLQEPGVESESRYKPIEGDGECAMCGAIGSLVDDGEAAICADRAACDERLKAHSDKVMTDLDAIISQDDQAADAAFQAAAIAEVPGDPPVAPAPTICAVCHVRQNGAEGDNCAADPNCIGVLETPGEEMGEGADWDADAERQDLEFLLFAALRNDVVGGEVFDCAACGTAVSSVKTKDTVVPARDWLRELAAQQIDKPLCLTDARKALKGRSKTAQNDAQT